MKALAFKYAETTLTLTEEEWKTIKLYKIDARQWLHLNITHEEYYNKMIGQCQNLINN